MRSAVTFLIVLLTQSLAAADRPTATVDGKTYPVYEYQHEVKPLKTVSPRMPASAVRAGRGGSVEAGAVVNETGRVQKAYINQAEAEGDIRAAVVTAIKDWKFPVMRDSAGQAISYVVLIPVSLSPAPANAPAATPVLAGIISDAKHLRGALGLKALLITNPKTGEVSPEIIKDVKAAGLAESVQFIPFPKEGIQPKPKKREAPIYPPELHRKGIAGAARYLFVISAEGKVTGIYCSEASRPEFALAGAAALVQWRFDPASIQGTPVPVLVSQLLEFEG